MAGFNFEPTTGDGKFRIGRKPSIFVNGAEFTLTAVVTGIWRNDAGDPINKDDANSIRFKTSLSDDIDDTLNINKLLNRRRIVYDADGHASILFDFEGHNDLMNFLEKEIGRDEKNAVLLNGTAKSVGERVLDFYKDTVFVVKEVECFFKSIKDGVEKLELPITPVCVISTRKKS